MTDFLVEKRVDISRLNNLDHQLSIDIDVSMAETKNNYQREELTRHVLYLTSSSPNVIMYLNFFSAHQSFPHFSKQSKKITLCIARIAPASSGAQLSQIHFEIAFGNIG